MLHFFLLNPKKTVILTTYVHHCFQHIQWLKCFEHWNLSRVYPPRLYTKDLPKLYLAQLLSLWLSCLRFFVLVFSATFAYLLARYNKFNLSFFKPASCSQSPNPWILYKGWGWRGHIRGRYRIKEKYFKGSKLEEKARL